MVSVLLSLSSQIYFAVSSLKSRENLEVIRQIPLERIMVESDAPWCEIRPSSAAHPLLATKFKGVAKEKYQPDTMLDTMVKGRNEPFACRQVLEAIAALHQRDLEEVAEIVFETTDRIFGQPQ